MKKCILFILISTISQAQGIKRQAISSNGSSFCNEGTLYRQTIGQTYNTGTRFSDQLSYRPGFQQPLLRDTPRAQKFSFVIFPNPADENFYVKCDAELSDAYVLVSDATGKQVFQEKYKSLTLVRVNCHGWSAGYYTVTLSNNREKLSHKLIINHQQ